VFRKRSAKPTHVVGLDLDPSHIAAADVVANGDLHIRRSAVAMLRPGIVRDGEVTDPAALSEALRELFEAHDLPRRVRIGVANQRIVMRTMDLPPLLDDKALAAAVEGKAADHIPMPMDEAVIDFQSLGVVSTPQGPQTRVIIVAVRREVVDRLAQAVGDAGLSLEGIDLAAFAMVRAVGVDGDAARLYINVAGLTNVAVASAAGVLFARASAGGLESLVHTLAERRALTLEHARQWMVHVGMSAPLDEIEGDPDLVASTRHVLEEGIHEIADAVRSSVEYYRTQESAESVEDGILAGPGVAIAGFAEALGAQLRLPLVSACVKPVEGYEVGGDPGRLTVAAGLAVEERELRAS
jgi:type IV pilus assembly protein PilM